MDLVLQRGLRLAHWQKTDSEISLFEPFDPWRKVFPPANGFQLNGNSGKTSLSDQFASKRSRFARQSERPKVLRNSHDEWPIRPTRKSAQCGRRGKSCEA